MLGEQLKLGKVYRYQGDRLAHADIQFTATDETCYGTQYLFNVVSEDEWRIGGVYRISERGLENVVEIKN